MRCRYKDHEPVYIQDWLIFIHTMSYKLYCATYYNYRNITKNLTFGHTSLFVRFYRIYLIKTIVYIVKTILIIHYRDLTPLNL